MGRTLRTLFCALLATAIVPSTLRAAYAEVQAVQAADLHGRQAAPASPVEKPARPTHARARSSRIASPSVATSHFYVRYCRLLR
jgi:hypothetical protein